jgi:hypothetical protein
MTFDSDGTVRFIYGDDEAQLVREEFDTPRIERASHVEPSAGGWVADIVGGPSLGPFTRRRDALDAEVQWLQENRNL